MPNTHRWDCSQDHLVVAAVEQGFGRELVLSGIETFERANEIRKGIYRCARHRGLSPVAGPSRLVTGADEMGIHKDRGTYTLRYKIYQKRIGKAYLISRYGTDRANWPYDPRRKATGAERDSWAPRNERGEPVTH